MAEADLRRLIARSDLPTPMFNARLLVSGGFVAIVDAWWPQAGVAVEVDSRQWHISPADWEKTLERHARMTALGILVLHIVPRRLRAEGSLVIAEIRSTLASAKGRALPDVVAEAA